jgi:hypothetical protein
MAYRPPRRPGKTLFHMTGVLSELDRAMIQERMLSDAGNASQQLVRSWCAPRQDQPAIRGMGRSLG